MTYNKELARDYLASIMEDSDKFYNFMNFFELSIITRKYPPEHLLSENLALPRIHAFYFLKEKVEVGDTELNDVRKNIGTIVEELEKK